MILGLDLASRTGWALLTSTGERVASGVWILGDDDDATRAYRFLRLRKRMRELWMGKLDDDLTFAGAIELVAYEEPLPPDRMPSKAQAFSAYGLAATAEQVAAQWQVEIRAIDNRRAKAAGGVVLPPAVRGRLSELDRARARADRRAKGKAITVSRVRDLFGVDVEDDNEADALLVALAAIVEGV